MMLNDKRRSISISESRQIMAAASTFIIVRWRERLSETLPWTPEDQRPKDEGSYKQVQGKKSVLYLNFRPRLTYNIF